MHFARYTEMLEKPSGDVVMDITGERFPLLEATDK
jgi:hypothetical protein